jgi:ribonuclease PH
MEFVSPEGLRLDGRRPKELRQLKAELGVLQSADGSATFEMGNTKVKIKSSIMAIFHYMLFLAKKF